LLTRDELDELLCTCAREMVATYESPQCSWASAAPGNTHGIVVATLTFSASSVRGVMTLMSPRDFVGQLQTEVQARDTALRDVLGEIANLLGGRLKRHLLSRGVAIRIGTPSTGIAENIRIRPDENPFGDCHALEFTRGRVFMRLDVTIDPTLVVTASVPPEAHSVCDEGGLFFLS
jgi:hypothetical protein